MFTALMIILIFNLMALGFIWWLIRKADDRDDEYSLSNEEGEKNIEPEKDKTSERLEILKQEALEIGLSASHIPYRKKLSYIKELRFGKRHKKCTRKEFNHGKTFKDEL